GYPRSDMAQKFNLPIRSTYLQTFSTDARGFRNAADLDRAELALVGDSYVEGAYVSDNETAAVRLGALTGHTVVNLGVSGYGTTRRLYFYGFDATREIGEYERDRFEVTKATFVRINALCRARGVRLIVFYIPMKFRVYGSFCRFPAGSPCPAWHPWDLESR